MSPSNGHVGVHLADTSMWLLFASILVFFDLSAPVEDGRPILPSGRFLDGSIRHVVDIRYLRHYALLMLNMNSHPEQFKCTIMPRKGAEEAIHLLSDD